MDRKEDENTAGQRVIGGYRREDTTLVKRREKTRIMIIRDLQAKLADNELESIVEELV